VVSYAKADSERTTGPSPLFSHLSPWRRERMAIAPARSAEFERVVDDQGPPVEITAMTSGGTRALELQAKCPFRAFAEIRLNARELESPEPGFDPRERGGFLHAALEHFFRRFPSSAALKATSAEAISQGLAEGVDLALAKCKVGDNELAGKLVELERVRLIELLESWIELEKQREIEFTVEEPEQERTVEIGGITVQVRLDRLDRLATGSYALVDYKSRAPRLGDWDGDRPESPQLPIYAVTAREPLAALAFAQVRTGANAFKGYSTVEGSLPGMKPVDPAVLSARIEEWRRVFEILGNAFRDGRAAVDPKVRFKTCELCHLSSLCRVKEK
jgi:probable DNA repair protein